MALQRLRKTQLTKLPDGLHADGGNLYLRVRGGSRSWVFRFRFGGKRHDLGLGSLTAIPIDRARELAAELREKIHLGVHPILEKVERKKADREKAELAVVRTFDSLVVEAVRHHMALKRITTHNYESYSLTVYKKHIAPFVGKTDINLLRPIDVANVLRPLWDTRAQTASKVLGIMRMCYAYATAMGRYSGTPPTTWKSCLDAFLPQWRSGSKARASWPWEELPGLYKKIGTTKSVDRCLAFIILSGLRATAAACIRREDVDLKRRVIYVRVRKNKRLSAPFTVPLTDQMVPLLGDDPEFLFPSSRGKPFTHTRMYMRLQEIIPGETCTVHGFRATFSTWCAEHGKDPTLRETCLDHVTDNAVAAAYQRSDLLERRRVLMQEWADFVTSAR